MKDKQKSVLKFLLVWTIPMLVSFGTMGQDAALQIKKADSLFAQKLYTQSFEIYKSVFDQKLHSQSMLLKMAFIQEGLGHVSQSMYYLNLYYLVSNDELALQKMEKVASENRLSGYSRNDETAWMHLVRENFTAISRILIGLTIFVFSLLIYQKRKLKKKPYIPGILMVLVSGLLFVHINFSDTIEKGIVVDDLTYIMSGPSAGSSVVSVINEGHQLKITGQKDIWLKVKWKDKDAYIKENQLLKVEL